MEQETKTNTEASLNDVFKKGEPVQVNPEEDDKENISDDGEFFKVERETYEISDGSRDVGVTTTEQDVQSVSESHEKIKELEIQLERVSATVKDYESQNVNLKEKLSLTEKKYEQLELNHKKLAGMKESFESLNLESEKSKKKISELEEKLQSHEIELDELVKSSQEQIEDSNERVNVLESLLEEKNRKIEEQEKQITSLSEKLELEVKELTYKLFVAEGQARQATEFAECRKAEIDEMVKMAVNQELNYDDLIEKVAGFEKQIKMHQETSSDASTVAESRKAEIEEMGLKLKEQTKLVEELLVKLGQIEISNEALAEANMKLTMDRALSETDQNDVVRKLSNVVSEKNEISALYQLSNQKVEDLTHELSSVKQELREYKEKEDALKTKVENLNSEVSEKAALQARLKDLEEQFQISETQLKDEVSRLQATATSREADLTSQLENHILKLGDRDLLNPRVLQLEQELQIAQTSFTNLKEESSAMLSKLKDEKRHTSEELVASNKEAMISLTKIEELEQKLLDFDALSKQKASESEAENPEQETETRSRDTGLEFTRPINPKSKNSENSSAVVQNTTTEASSTMNAKFIIGVTLISIIFGVILRKIY